MRLWRPCQRACAALLLTAVACGAHSEDLRRTAPAPAAPPSAPPRPAAPPVEKAAPAALDFTAFLGKDYDLLRAELLRRAVVDPRTERRSTEFGPSVRFAGGIEISLDAAGRVDTVFLFFRAAGESSYAGPLPAGLRADMSVADIQAMLGRPDETGGGRPSSLDGHTIPVWIKYLRPQAQIHFEFTGTGALRQITFMPPGWTPGR